MLWLIGCIQLFTSLTVCEKVAVQGIFAVPWNHTCCYTTVTSNKHQIRMENLKDYIFYRWNVTENHWRHTNIWMWSYAVHAHMNRGYASCCVRRLADTKQHLSHFKKVTSLFQPRQSSTLHSALATFSSFHVMTPPFSRFLFSTASVSFFVSKAAKTPINTKTRLPCTSPGRYYKASQFGKCLSQ